MRNVLSSFSEDMVCIFSKSGSSVENLMAVIVIVGANNFKSHKDMQRTRH